MKQIITAIFVRKSILDRGKDQDYKYFEFTDIVDNKKNPVGGRLFKETKLLNAVRFEKGKRYTITLSRKHEDPDVINLPYPVEIAWDQERVYSKNGNSIIRVDKRGKETNLSISPRSLINIDFKDRIFSKAFYEGLMTEELLAKANSRGMFFIIHVGTSMDKRRNDIYSVGYMLEGKANCILIQRETKKEMNRDLKEIKRKYLPHGIEKHFEITTEILVPQKRK